MTWRVRLAVAAVVAAALLPAVAADAAPARPLLVTGYVESGDGPAAVTPSLGALTTLGVDGVNISATGTAVGAPDAASKRLLSQAHAHGRSAELLVGNFSSALGDFDERAAHRLLTSPTNRAAVVRALVGYAAAGWDGIHLDFESLAAGDRAGLTAFSRELRQALPSGTTLAMAVMAADSIAGYRATGYDLPALARSLDRVVLMAYDQHGPGWTAAGPVGGLPWVRRVLTALLSQVPAGQVDLGVAGYGYSWPTSGDGRQWSDTGARATAVDPRWDARQGEWHGRLDGGGQIWWSDHRSLVLRERLARQAGLHGVAVWSLGLSDPVS
ncbi:glycosyl hydrolase family 18 protein [Jatrophihabitans sp. YIM 134969]